MRPIPKMSTLKTAWPSFQWLGWFYEKNLNDPLEAKKYYQESKILLLELVSDFPQYTEFKRNLNWVENRLKR